MEDKTKQVLAKVRTELDTRTNLPKARIDRVMQAVQATLPKADALASGILVVWIKNTGSGTGIGVAQCTGGHLCEGQDSTPGDGPDCDIEACNTEVCRDGHECNNQSCGTEACDGQHTCTGTYKGVLDASGFGAQSRRTWRTLQQKIDALKAQDQLDVEVMLSK
jgi:hypothetical protein